MKSLAEIPFNKIYIGMPVRFTPTGLSGIVRFKYCGNNGDECLTIQFKGVCEQDDFYLGARHKYLKEICLDPTRM